MQKIHALAISLVLCAGLAAAGAVARGQALVPTEPAPSQTAQEPAQAPQTPPAPTTPDEALERAGEAARALGAGELLLGTGGLLWLLFTLLRLPQLGGHLERVPPAWRPLLVLGSGLAAACAFALGGAVPGGLLEALGLGAGGAGLAMGAHETITPARRAARARREARATK
jgi:hypothetical protein